MTAIRTTTSTPQNDQVGADGVLRRRAVRASCRGRTPFQMKTSWLVRLRQTTLVASRISALKRIGEVAAAGKKARGDGRRHQRHRDHDADQGARQPRGDRQRRGRAGGERENDVAIPDMGPPQEFDAFQVGRQHQRRATAASTRRDRLSRRPKRSPPCASAPRSPERDAEREGEIGAEQRRDHHGADDDGDVVLVQADRRDDGRDQREDDEVDVEPGAAGDILVDLFPSGGRADRIPGA